MFSKSIELLWIHCSATQVCFFGLMFIAAVCHEVIIIVSTGRAPDSHNLGDGIFLSQQDLNAASERLKKIVKKEQEEFLKKNSEELQSEYNKFNYDMDECKYVELDDEEIRRFRDNPEAVGRTNVTLISAGK